MHSFSFSFLSSSAAAAAAAAAAFTYLPTYTPYLHPSLKREQSRLVVWRESWSLYLPPSLRPSILPLTCPFGFFHSLSRLYALVYFSNHLLLSHKYAPYFTARHFYAQSHSLDLLLYIYTIFYLPNKASLSIMLKTESHLAIATSLLPPSS